MYTWGAQGVEPCESTPPRAPIKHKTLRKCQGFLPQDEQRLVFVIPRTYRTTRQEEHACVLFLELSNVNTHATPPVLLAPCFEPVARFPARTPLSLLAPWCPLRLSQLSLYLFIIYKIRFSHWHPNSSTTSTPQFMSSPYLSQALEIQMSLWFSLRVTVWLSSIIIFNSHSTLCVETFRSSGFHTLPVKF